MQVNIHYNKTMMNTFCKAPYAAPEILVKEIQTQKLVCASLYDATNEGYTDYGTEYTLE